MQIVQPKENPILFLLLGEWGGGVCLFQLVADISMYIEQNAFILELWFLIFLTDKVKVRMLMHQSFVSTSLTPPPPIDCGDFKGQ